MKAIIASIMLFLAMVGCATAPMVGYARPFGYEMGQSVEGEGKPSATRHGVPLQRYITTDILDRRPYKSLTLTYTPNVGLCKLRASVLGGFDDMVGRLTAKYGKPRYAARAGCIYHRCYDTSSAYWKPNVHDVKTIQLFTEGIGSTLYYEFRNFDECKKEAVAVPRPNDSLQGVL